MKNHSLICVVALLAMLITGWAPVFAQEEEDLQCVLDALDAAERGQFTRAECTILQHRFIVTYNDPILHATVSGPVVNTSRTFNIPRVVSAPPTFKGSEAGASPQAQSGKEEAILWIMSVYEQITSGLSLSSVSPSTNPALNSTLRTFGAVVMPNVRPQARAQKPTEPAGEQAEQEGEKRGEGKPGEISTDVEFESFTFVKLDGKTISFRGAFERTTDTGGLGFGLRLAYSRVSFDANDNTLQTGEATGFIKIPLANIFEIGANVTGTASRLKTGRLDANVNTVGYGPFLALHVASDAGHMLAGGLMYQIVSPDEDLEPDKENLRLLAYGAMGVVNVNEKLAISVEGFRMDNLELEGSDDAFSILHPQVHFYLSDSFGLIFGYKTVLGIDDYDSSEFTIGSSIRF